MADMYIRLKDLDEETINDLAYYVEIDGSDFTESKKITVANFLEPETTAREDADDTIELACGLETDGTFKPNDTSHYVRSSDFVTAGISADLKNAITLLDAKIYTLENRLFFEVFFNFSSAVLKSLAASPVTIYASLPGYFADVLFPIGKLTYGTSTYHAEADLVFQINSITVASLPIALIEETVDSIYRGAGAANIKLASNTAILATTTGTEFDTGDGTLRARLLMELVDENLSGTTLQGGCCNIPQHGSFVNADLVGGKLTIKHNLGTKMILGVAITDDSNDVKTYDFACGDAGGLDTDNNITVDLSAVAPIAVTWTYYFIAIQI